MKIYILFSVLIITMGFSATAQTDKEDYKMAVDYFNLANSLKQQYKFDEAELKFGEAAILFLKHNYIGNYIQSKYSIADINIQKNKINDAELILSEIEKKAIEKYGENNKFLTNIYFGKGVVSAYKGKNDEAIDYYNKSSALNDKAEKPNIDLKSSIYGGLGNAYSEKGNMNLALENYKKDLELKKSYGGDNHPLLPVAYNNIANVYKSTGEFDLSLEYIEKALSLNPADNYKALFYSGKGNIYYEKGQYDLALDFFQSALKINKSVYGNNHKTVADNLNSIGIVYLKKDDYDKALIFFIDAYDIQVKVFGEDHPDIAGTSNNIGNILKNQKKYETSIKYYEKAKTIKTKYFGSNHPELATYNNNLGINYYNLNKYDIALQYYAEAVRILESNYGNKFSGIISIYLNIADIYRAKKQYDKSLYFYQKSISANVKTFNPGAEDYYSNPTIDTYSDINKLLYSLDGKTQVLDALYTENLDPKDLKASYETYILTDKVISIARKKVEKKSDKIFLGNKTKNIYENAVIATKNLSDITDNEILKRDLSKKAFYFAEKNKAVVLSEAVTASEAKQFSDIPNYILENEKVIKTGISEYEKLLAESTSAKNSDKYEDSLFRLNDALRKLEKQIEANYPNYFKSKYKDNDIDITGIQNYLDENTAIRSYFLGRDVIIIFTITKEDISITSIDKPADFDQKVKDFNKYITSGYESSFILYLKSANDFYNLFFPDRISEKIKKMVIIPDGMIGLIPFEALITEDFKGNISSFKEYPFLIKKYQVSYAYSAGLLYKLMKNNKSNSKPKTWLGVAPVFENIKNRDINGVKATELPGSKEEVNKIEALFKSNNFTTSSVIDQSATESYLKSSPLNSFKYIHIATHGIVNTFEPNLSGLLLYPELTKNDGILFSGEIYNLELDADLAVLSACETGIGQISKSEGIIGLSRSLLYAGADNIIVSLWKVSDASTTFLMVDFYTYLLKNEKDKAGSLHNAKMKMIETGDSFAHPFFWSPFVLIGI